jgi:hypothetical protein
MNPFRLSIIVATKIHTAPTLMDLSCALGAMDILEMGLVAKINRNVSFWNKTFGRK